MVGRPKGLTARQKKFCERYVELGNAVRAAEEAGFSTSYAQGAMRQAAVQAYIAELQEEHIPKFEVIQFLKDVMAGKIERDELRVTAAVQLGIRARLWRGVADAMNKIEEV